MSSTEVYNTLVIVLQKQYVSYANRTLTKKNQNKTQNLTKTQPYQRHLIISENLIIYYSLLTFPNFQ